MENQPFEDKCLPPTRVDWWGDKREPESTRSYKVQNKARIYILFLPTSQSCSHLINWSHEEKVIMLWHLATVFQSNFLYTLKIRLIIDYVLLDKNTPHINIPCKPICLEISKMYNYFFSCLCFSARTAWKNWCWQTNEPYELCWFVEMDCLQFSRKCMLASFQNCCIYVTMLGIAGG